MRTCRKCEKKYDASRTDSRYCPKCRKKIRQKKYRAKKKNLRSRADALWHKAGIKKWGDTCFFHPYQERAKNHRYRVSECHHFKPKGNYGHLRYDLDNAVPICRACHLKLEQYDKSMEGIIIQERGLDWHKELLEKARNRPENSYANHAWYRNHIKRLKEEI